MYTWYQYSIYLICESGLNEPSSYLFSLLPSNHYNPNIFTAPKLKIIMHMEATRFPITIVGKAYLNLRSSSEAMRLPVHTPVPGRGIATKINSPQYPYFLTLPLLLRDLWMSLCMTFLKVLVSFK